MVAEGGRKAETDDALLFLGLCRRAGALVTGEEGVLNALASGEAKLVLMAHDASDNTRKRFTNKCASRRVELVTYGTGETLGRAVGKNVTMVTAVLDEGFARGIRKKTGQPEGQEEERRLHG